MAYRVLFLTIALFIGVSGTSFSQIRLPDVTGPIVQKLPVFIPDLSSVGPSNPKGREFVEVLRNDLQNAALFDVSSGGATIGTLNNINFQAIFDAGVDYLIAGQYQTVGNKIKFAVQLYNVKEERPILGRSYVATPGKVREAAHKFADLAMKQIGNRLIQETQRITQAAISRTCQHRECWRLGLNIFRIANMRQAVFDQLWRQSFQIELQTTGQNSHREFLWISRCQQELDVGWRFLKCL